MAMRVGGMVCGLAAAAILNWAAGSAAAAMKDTERPFMLWTKGQAAEMKKMVETEEWAKKAYAEMQTAGGRGGTFRNLFKYVVMGDVKAGEAEKKYLLGIIGTTPQGFEKLEHGGRHYDCYLDALRYDAVHDLLTPEERGKVEATFRNYIEYQLTDKKEYTRTSWLPNMQWPRVMSAHIMAVSLKDEKNIRALVNGNGGFKWYFDSYLGPDGFYMEEFGKHYSMIGEVLIFAQGLERLGLNEMGFGYVGKNGATVRKYAADSIVAVGYPRVEIPGGLPFYGKITMGDARGSGFAGAPPYVFQHAIVNGYMANGKGGMDLWGGANMNGRDHKNAKVDKLGPAQWFEFASAKWPDGKYDYFLAQMRNPGQEAYIPTLFWGAKPADVKKVTAPAAKSWSSFDRGLAFLRAEESPAYWESAAPAVALQYGSYYVHYTSDCLALLGMTAFNRPIYYNRQLSDGYGGGDPWTDSLRGHCGVIVDNAKGKVVDGNDAGAVNQQLRNAFGPLAKFASVKADGVFLGVKQQRSLFLTREYLVDVSDLASETPRKYEWQVHALGLPLDVKGWSATEDLAGGKLYEGAPGEEKAKSLLDRYDMQNVKKLEAGEKAWSAGVVQDCAIGVEKSLLGKAWYERRIGVNVSMLPEAGTVVYMGDTPRFVIKEGAEPGKGEKSQAGNEVGGTTVLVRRNTKGTVFAALHEPFEKGTPKIGEFRRVQQNEAGLAAAVVGGGVNDRVLLQFDPKASSAMTLSGDGESFAFLSNGFVRVGAERVEVEGQVTGLVVKVKGTPKLVVNGKAEVATVEGGVLKWKR